MGTRADYYIGTGPDARWLGSTGMDGHPQGVCEDLLMSKKEAERLHWTERQWITRVHHLFNKHDEHTLPEAGWPWPWTDSNTTDYTYTMVPGAGVMVSCFGSLWCPLWQWLDEKFMDVQESLEMHQLDFPDMTSIQKIRWDAGNAPMLFGQKADGRMGLVNDEWSVVQEAEHVVEKKRKGKSNG